MQRVVDKLAGVVERVGDQFEIAVIVVAVGRHRRRQRTGAVGVRFRDLGDSVELVVFVLGAMSQFVDSGGEIAGRIVFELFNGFVRGSGRVGDLLALGPADRNPDRSRGRADRFPYR